MRHVIHTVGPVFESSEESAPLLRSAYRRVKGARRAERGVAALLRTLPLVPISPVPPPPSLPPQIHRDLSMIFSSARAQVVRGPGEAPRPEDGGIPRHLLRGVRVSLPPRRQGPLPPAAAHSHTPRPWTQFSNPRAPAPSARAPPFSPYDSYNRAPLRRNPCPLPPTAPPRQEAIAVLAEEAEGLEEVHFVLFEDEAWCG